MKKVPISIIIDDPSPIVMVYWSHHKTRVLTAANAWEIACEFRLMPNGESEEGGEGGE